MQILHMKKITLGRRDQDLETLNIMLVAAVCIENLIGHVHPSRYVNNSTTSLHLL